MNRDRFFWTLALFFGASIGFRAIQNATDDEALWVTLVAELALLAVLVLAIVVVVKRRER